MGTSKHIRAILLLPVMAAVVVPGTLVFLTGFDTLALWERWPSSRLALWVGGALLVGAGLTLMASTIRLFATLGQGTLAPWNPPQNLVVNGVYRHVRNPMISGVFLVLIGEAAGCASLALVGWAAIFIAGNMVYMPLVEEPGLVRRFGEDYEKYRRNVPRWVPRMKPWKPGQQ